MVPVSQMKREDFLATFAGVYEHSPWVAERAWDQGLTTAEDTAKGLHRAMIDVVETAGREPQMSLLRAHPDLAGKLAARGDLTTDSSAEQASAGLDRCTQEEFSTLQNLNNRYKTTFNFPFIVAVRGRNVADIIENFQTRIDNDIEIEFDEARQQVHHIAALRLNALID